MGLKGYRKRYLLLVCSSIILFVLEELLPQVRNEAAPEDASGEVGLSSSSVSPNPSSFAGKAVWKKLAPIGKNLPQTTLKLTKYPFKRKLYKLKKKPNKTKENKNELAKKALPTTQSPGNPFAFSEHHLAECRRLALETARKTLKKEMSNYKFVDNTTLQDHLLQNGGKPIRNILITTWRSGSTFLGETIVTHAGTFYHYEPFLRFGIVQIRDEPLVSQAVSDLRDLMHCNYANMSDYIDFGRNKTYLFTHNTRLWNYCQTNPDVCMDPTFLGEMCRIFPIQAIKTVRLRLKLIKDLLNDPDLDLRVLYLVRDPRGTMQSRLHRRWCGSHPDCDNPQALCSDLEDDFYEAEKLRAAYPDRFMAIRFEDMTANVVAAAKNIFKFLRLQYIGLVDEFIANHTRKDYGGPSSTYRDTKAAPFHWIQDLQNNVTYVRRVQDSCTTALSLWGYNLLSIPKDLTSPDFHPVNSPPWPNMTFTDSN